MASVVIYARVSTEEGQDTAAQVRVCREYAERNGYTVHEVYEDHASAVNFRGRKAWRTMMADMKRWHPRTRPKAILAYALDRVIRSMLDYVNITEQLKTLDVALVTADGTLGEIGDPGDPNREFMADVLVLIAQLERKIIIRRTRDGIKNAQAKGVQFGRPRREIDWAAGRRCRRACQHANAPRPRVSLLQRFRLLNDAVPKRGCCPAGLNR